MNVGCNWKLSDFLNPGNDNCGTNFGVDGADGLADEKPDCGVEGADKCNDEKCGEGVCVGNTGVCAGNTGVGKTGTGVGWTIGIVWAICACCVDDIGV